MQRAGAAQAEGRSGGEAQRLRAPELLVVSSGDVAAVVKQEVRKGFNWSLAPLLTKARAASSRGGVQVCLFQPLVDSRAGTWKSSSGSISPMPEGRGLDHGAARLFGPWRLLPRTRSWKNRNEDS